MKVIVEAESLCQIAETIKQLPVQGDFEVSNMWVGCVIALEQLYQTSPQYKEPEVNETIEQG